MVKDGGNPLLDAVQIQRVGAGPGARKGQMAVNIPPLAVQDLVEIGRAEAVDTQPPGQGGVDVGMGVHQARHDDAALGVDKLCVRVLGLQLRGGAHRHDLRALDGYAAVREIGDRAVPGDQPSVCQNIHRVSSSSFPPPKEKCFKPSGLKHSSTG